MLILFGEGIGKDLEFGFGHRELGARLQLDEGEPVLRRIPSGKSGHINVRITPGEAWGGDADDGEDLMVELDCFSDDVAAAAKLALPEDIAQYGNGSGVSARCVCGREFSAEQRRNTHILK